MGCFRSRTFSLICFWVLLLVYIDDGAQGYSWGVSSSASCLARRAHRGIISSRPLRSSRLRARARSLKGRHEWPGEASRGVGGLNGWFAIVWADLKRASNGQSQKRAGESGLTFDRDRRTWPYVGGRIMPAEQTSIRAARTPTGANSRRCSTTSALFRGSPARQERLSFERWLGGCEPPSRFSACAGYQYCALK